MIDLERWDEIKAIVQAALDLPAEQQAAYLEEACRGDQELRRQVDVLLAVSATRADFYDDFQVLPPGFQTVTLREGDAVGDYTVIRPLGKGGMGAVYLAEDTRHDRQVALKVLPSASRQVPMHEQRALAKLHHPNIATFYDSGQTKDGFAYFVMEFVEGEPITTYCESRGLTVAERLRLFHTVCDAVSYAHRNLVVHRDIKPANILVTNEGQPKLLDFGIAKLISPELAAQTITQPEDRSLTVAFASPEQLSGEHTSTSTDIYSLGVLLCLLLTGRLPYPVKSYHEIPWAVRNIEPERPSQLVLKQAAPTEEDADPPPLKASALGHSRHLARRLSGDLDAIVLRALRKEPEKRYHTVTEMAEDVRRHLAILPVSARPASRRYRTGKFLRRRAGRLLGVGVVVAIIFAMSALLVGQYRRAVRGERQASAQAERTRHINRFVVDLLRRTDPFEQGASANTSVDELLDQSARFTTTSLNSYPDLKASLLSVLGEIFGNRGDTQRAQVLLETALALQRSGPRDQALAETLHRYGMVLAAQGHYRESDGALVEAGEILSKLQEQSDPVLASRILVAQAANRIHQADYESAHRFSQAALASLRHSPSSFPELAASLLSLGRVLDIKDQDAEAEALLRQALSYAERISDARNYRVAAIASSLGALLAERGDYGGARSMYLQALDIKRAAHGESSTVYAVTLHNLATLDSAQGKYQEALDKFTQVVLIFQKNLPPNHERILTTRDQLASTLVLLHEFERAEKIFLEVLAARRAAHGERHPAVAGILNNLAYLYQEQGRLQEAQDFYQQALDIFTELVGRNSLPVAALLGNLGSIAQRRGDIRTAEARFREALGIARGTAGGKGPTTVSALVNLTSFYISTGDLQRAKELASQATSLAESVIGPGDWLTGYTYYMEAKLLLAQGDVSHALSRVRQARAILAARLPSHDWRIAATDLLLGAALGQAGETNEAEKLLLRSLSELRRLKGDQSPHAYEAMERIHSFYKSLGRNAEAAKYQN